MRFGKRRQDSLFDPNKVDVVAESAEGIIELVIVQDQRRTGSDAQLASSEAKVQTYVSFALDGPLVQQFPEAAGRPWRIVVNCLSRQPDKRTQAMLETVASRLPEHGGSLLVRAGCVPDTPLIHMGVRRLLDPATRQRSDDQAAWYSRASWVKAISLGLR